MGVMSWLRGVWNGYQTADVPQGNCWPVPNFGWGGEDALFPLGITWLSDASSAACERYRVRSRHLFERHVRGDFGDISEEERAGNEAGIGGGWEPIVSRYRIPVRDGDADAAMVTFVVQTSGEGDHVNTFLSFCGVE